jgi:hypothetical protein
MEHRKESLAVMAAGLLALLLSGCVGSAVDAAGSGAAAGTAAPVASTSATPVASAPAAAHTPEASDPAHSSASCESVLTADEYTRLVEENLALNAQPYLLGTVMERMVAAGAVACVWSKPNSDISVWYARLDVGDGGGTWLTELEAEGWLEDTARGDGTYLAPADYDSNYQPSVQLSGGVLHFASYNVFLESVLELR